MNLGGWDVVSSIRLEHLNRALTAEVAGKPFSAKEDGSHLRGLIKSWVLAAPKGATCLSVAVDRGEVFVEGIGLFPLAGMVVSFPVDFDHLAATPSRDQDILKLKFDAYGIGPGDGTDLAVNWDCKELARLNNSRTEQTVRLVAGALTVNAMLADPTMAGAPIAVLMRKGSVHADWYQPKHVSFALSTLQNGQSFASILVSVQDLRPVGLPAQPPAELHAGEMNMALARSLFFRHVMVPSVKQKLGTQAKFYTFEDLAASPLLGQAFRAAGLDTKLGFYYTDLPLGTTFGGAFQALSAILPVGAPPVVNLQIRVVSATAVWDQERINTDLKGECALGGWGSLGWFEFEGAPVMQLGFDAAAQKLTLTLTSNPLAAGHKKGLAVLDFIGGEPSFDTGHMAAAVCGLRDFPPPASYAFEWAGVKQAVFDRADFHDDVFFSGRVS